MDLASNVHLQEVDQLKSEFLRNVNHELRTPLAVVRPRCTENVQTVLRWANLADAKLPIDVSQTLLDCVHARWDVVWRAMKPEEFMKVIEHEHTADTDQPVSAARLTRS